jgi:radical SAM superfamily enzyme YgiQ (UPF0313 family)
MRVSFIRPSMHGHPGRDTMEPLCFAILRGLTPPEVETTLLDEQAESIRFDEPTDLAALTVETYTARRAYQIAAHYRSRGVPVVMGGHHPSVRPEETLRHADAVVRGDAERVWGTLLADAARGHLRPIYHDKEPPPLNGLRVDRSPYRGIRYAPLTLVQYGRGCRFHCDFCSIHVAYGTQCRQRAVGDVVEEIARAGGRYVFFVDDNLFAGEDAARELFEALIPLHVRWICQVSADVVRHPELVRLMARSGCAVALIGFESLDPANLRQMRKGWALRAGEPAECVRTLQRAGIMVYGTFLFGYDGDTTRSFDATVDFATRQRFILANFNPLTPMPGTALYDRLEREQRLLFRTWWLDPAYRYGHSTFEPAGMSAPELTEGVRRARTRFYSVRSITERLLGSRTTLRSTNRIRLFLGANVVSRLEVRAKHGRPLGVARRSPSPGT